MAAGARVRGARGGARGLKGLREEEGRSFGVGGRNGDKPGWPCGEAEMGGRTITTSRRMTAEKELRRQGHD